MIKESVFHITRMDCAAEEQAIRFKLDMLPGVAAVHCNLDERLLRVYHDGPIEEIARALASLELGEAYLTTREVVNPEMHEKDNERRVLRIVLAINLIFFGVEMTAGLISWSMGLVADSLDMLADAFVYALALVAVGRSVLFKRRVASIAGYVQLALAVLGLMEVIRRFLRPDHLPDFVVMIGVSVLAFGANLLCLYLLQKMRTKEVHIRASMIFTSNDMIINAGVITAGLLVLLTRSQIPDLIIGTLVFLLVVRGASRILSLGR